MKIFIEMFKNLKSDPINLKYSLEEKQLKMILLHLQVYSKEQCSENLFIDIKKFDGKKTGSVSNFRVYPKKNSIQQISQTMQGNKFCMKRKYTQTIKEPSQYRCQLYNVTLSVQKSLPNTGLEHYSQQRKEKLQPEKQEDFWQQIKEAENQSISQFDVSGHLNFDADDFQFIDPDKDIVFENEWCQKIDVDTLEGEEQYE